ncbi:MAG TPA: hypothetical protein EYG89_00705 [Bacteroidia bacterium]|nr:hypothetical protein [Bacteroidia bacterium]
MTLIEQIKTNIKAADFEYGESIRGKGLEIFHPTTNVLFRHKDRNDGKEFFSKQAAEKNANLILSKIEQNKDKFFIQFDLSKYKFDINEKTLVDTLTKHFSFSLYEKAKKIGYIKVSNYDKSYDSQCKLIMDLVKLDGYDVDNEAEVLSDQYYDTFDGIREINATFASRYYDTMGDGYKLLSGENLAYRDNDDIKEIDTRLDYYDDNILNSFWEYGGINQMKDYIEEIDSYGDITVYHRKGKDFYVAPSIQIKECYIETYSDEYGFEEEYIKFIFKKSNLTEKINKIVSIIESEKKVLEVESCIALKVNEDGYFNQNILNEHYDGDITEFGYEIINYVDWNSNQDTMILVNTAIEKLLLQNIKDKKLFNKYTHLKKLEELALRDGKKLVYTKVGEFTDDKAFALSFKNEEYHFYLSELYATTPQRLYSQISNALTKRLLEKLDQSVLLRKAKNVFVGPEDSFASGNCKHGTHSFCSQHNIDTEKIGAIRGDVLLKIDYSSFTKCAVMRAIVRSVA